MSYSFNVRAATKAEAKALVASKLAEVVANQPSHELDHAQANAAASAFIDLLPDDDAKDLSVSVNGSMGWQGTWGDGHAITGTAVGVNAWLVAREVASA